MNHEIDALNGQTRAFRRASNASAMPQPINTQQVPLPNVDPTALSAAGVDPNANPATFALFIQKNHNLAMQLLLAFFLGIWFEQSMTRLFGR